MVFGGGFFPAFEVNGRRQRLGLEVDYEVERASIAAELIRVHDERLGQGFDNEDLEPLIANGWYIAGTWLAAGTKPGGDADRAWTWGVNWYVNQLIRVQGNIIRERLDNAVRAPTPAQHVYWSSVVRFQFVL